MKLLRSSPQQALVCRMSFLFMEQQNTRAESKQILFSFSSNFFLIEQRNFLPTSLSVTQRQGRGEKRNPNKWSISKAGNVQSPWDWMSWHPNLHSKGGHHWDARDVKYKPWYLLNKVRSRNADSRPVPERQHGEDLLSFLETLTLFRHRPNGRYCSHLH